MANDYTSESVGMRLAMKGSQLTEHKSVNSPKGQPPSSKLQNEIQDTIPTTNHKHHTED